MFHRCQTAVCALMWESLTDLSLLIYSHNETKSLVSSFSTQIALFGCILHRWISIFKDIWVFKSPYTTFKDHGPTHSEVRKADSLLNRGKRIFLIEEKWIVMFLTSLSNLYFNKHILAMTTHVSYLQWQLK